VREDEADSYETLMALRDEMGDFFPSTGPLLRDQHHRVRRFAVEMLRGMGPKAGAETPHIVQALDSPFQLEGIAAIGKYTAAESVLPRLMRLLEAHPEPVVLALLRMGEKAIPSLVEVLEKNDPKLRRRGAHALGRMREHGSLVAPALERALEDRTPEVRIEAAQALLNLKKLENRAFSVLEEMLGHPDFKNRIRAASILSERGRKTREVLPVLIEALRGDDKWDAYMALLHLGPEARDAVPALVALLGDDQWAGRAIEVLGKIGPGASSAVPQLKELMKITRDPVQRKEIKWVLGMIQK
jgi:HEAT repeat protein